MVNLKNEWDFTFLIKVLSIGVLLAANPALTFCQQLISISGNVKDESSLGLAGVKVYSNNNRAATTDRLGNFEIRVAQTDTLHFFYEGFIEHTEYVGEREFIAVILQKKIIGLEEVVVVGYGTVKKQDLTGAVGQVSIEDLTKAPVGSFEEALAGRVAGVQVSSADGQPGAGIDIVIRGGNSITQSNSPLYVVDGFPIDEFTQGSISMDDISSISVLKDASAIAIYGARAANGVVVIETKRGKEGQQEITFNTSLGLNKVINTMEMMSPYEFVKYQSEAFPNYQSTKKYFDDGRTLDYYQDVEGTQWQDKLLRRGVIQSNNIAIRGGTQRTKYALSGSLYSLDGVIINSGQKQYTGRITLDHDVSKKLKIGLTANYVKVAPFGSPASGDGGGFTSFLLHRAYGYRPIASDPTLNLEEEFTDPEVLTLFDIRLNPIITTQNEYHKTNVSNLTTSVYLEYDILKDLVFKSTGSIFDSRRQTERFYNSKTAQGSPVLPANSKGEHGIFRYSEINEWANENTLTYKTAFDDKHLLSFLAGLSIQRNGSDGYGFTSQNVPNESLGMYGLDEGDAIEPFATGTASTLLSGFGRVEYNYDSKYLFTGTFRADGSSRFAPGNRWGYFPSAALAWNIHREDFMKPIKWISNAKLRMSYGVTGNNNIKDASYLSSLSFPIINAYSFNNGAPTKAAISGFGNALLKWESTSQLNAGLDLSFFKHRIRFSLDAYSKNTYDLLLDADVPYSIGYERILMNVGEVRNKGVEFSLSSSNIRTKSFTWSTSFNISFNRNEIGQLARGQEKIFSVTSFNTNPLYIAEVGRPVGMFYGYIWDGVYQYEDFDSPVPGTYVLKSNIASNGANRSTIQPGDVKYRDINGDGIVNQYDLAIIGRGQPVHTGGLANNFSYKGLSLHVFFQWSEGNQVYNANRLMFEGNYFGYANLNQFAHYANRWTPDNPSNKYVRAGGWGPPIRTATSQHIEDASYVRLKTASLSYVLPSNWVHSIGLNKIQLNVSGQNLFTWTKYSGSDPEVSVRRASALTPGFDFSAYPRSRLFTGGLNVTF